MPEDDEMPPDPIAALIANIDQVQATMPHIARMARIHFDAYINEGFNERQALYLAATQLLQNPGTAP